MEKLIFIIESTCCIFNIRKTEYLLNNCWCRIVKRAISTDTALFEK